MLTIIFYYLIFASGILAAYVDWEWFFTEAISFKNVENPVTNKSNDHQYNSG